MSSTHSHYLLPLPTILLSFLLFLTLPQRAFSLNITAVLSGYPDISDFNTLLSTTSVAQDLSQRSSLTLLVVPNDLLKVALTDLSTNVFPSSPATLPSNIADILRYHVLLEYFSDKRFERIPLSGKQVTTLYQTTGRATDNYGNVNVTRDDVSGKVYIRQPVSYLTKNVTVLSLVKTFPYNFSIYTVNSLLVPGRLDLITSEKQPEGYNITDKLQNSSHFNVAAALFNGSGVTDELEREKSGAGITMFVPTDEAFNELTNMFQGLSAESKAVVLMYHVLHSYYPLGSLESIVNPVQPTYATEDKGAGSFTLNITRVNGTIAIDTGLVLASITQTVSEHSPVAIFGISKVLLPKELFGKQLPFVSSGNHNIDGRTSALAPGVSLSPVNAPPDVGDSPDTLVSSAPPGVRELSVSSGGYCFNVKLISPALFCIGLYLLL